MEGGERNKQPNRQKNRLEVNGFVTHTFYRNIHTEIILTHWIMVTDNGYRQALRLAFTLIVVMSCTANHRRLISRNIIDEIQIAILAYFSL